MSKAETADTTCAPIDPIAPVTDMESPLHDLLDEIGTLGHIASSPNHIERGQLILLESHLLDLHGQLKTLWDAAWDEQKGRRAAQADLLTAHRTELKAVRAAKAAPGSQEEREMMEAMRWMLRNAATMILKETAPAQAKTDGALNGHSGIGEMIGLIEVIVDDLIVMAERMGKPDGLETLVSGLALGLEQRWPGGAWMMATAGTLTHSLTERKTVAEYLEAKVGTLSTPQPAADDELIRLCDEMLAAHAHYQRLDAEHADDQTTEDADTAMMAIADRIDTMTPVTLAGVRAKARAADTLWRINGHPQLEVHGMLAYSLIVGLAGQGADVRGGNVSPVAPASDTLAADTTAKATPDPLHLLDDRPDAALLHIAREYAKIHAQVVVLNELPTAEEAMDEVLNRQHALMDVMIATPAKGARGWRAKAEVLATAIEEDNSTFDPEVRLAATLARDLMEGIAPPR